MTLLNTLPPENQDLGVVKYLRKPVSKLDLSPFLHPLDKCAISLTCHGCSNVDPAAGALDELRRILPQIRQRWPQVQLIVRGDSAYRDDIMSWCEARKIDYVFGLAGNERLVRMTLPLQHKAQAQYQQRHQRLVHGLESYFQTESQSSEVPQLLVPEVVSVTALPYSRLLESYSPVVCKLSYDANGPHRRFVVTSIPASKVIPSQLYTEYYCPVGTWKTGLRSSS